MSNLHNLDYLRDVQPRLLGDGPTGLQLAQLPVGGPRPYAVNVGVNRAMPLEFVAGLADKVASSWETSLFFDYSDYDPGLASLVAGTHDIVLFWIDWRFQGQSMTPAEAVTWLTERIATLRLDYDGPIGVNNWPESVKHVQGLLTPKLDSRHWARQLNLDLDEALAGIPGTHVFDLAALAADVGYDFFDARNDRISSFPFSGRACAAIAQHLGGAFAYALVQPRLKAIVVDLDETLYQGVLGEDGAQQLIVTEGHQTLAAGLLALKRSGVLLGLCSKNNLADVERLFASRSADLVLTIEDFDAVVASWSAKSEGLLAIAEVFNIHPTAMVFLDDNPAELAEVSRHLPGVRLIHAGSGASSWAQLSRLPGLYQLQVDDLALARTADIKANARRATAHREAAGPVDYLASLGIHVSFARNRPADAKRLAEMSGKFNQFNLGLARLSEQQAATAMEEGHLTLTIRSKDRFSDSGLVGAFVFDLAGEHATLREALLSCRVLGRGLEYLGFEAALKQLVDRGVGRIDIHESITENNAPARTWIQSLTPQRQGVEVTDILELLETHTKNYPAQVEWI